MGTVVLRAQLTGQTARLGGKLPVVCLHVSAECSPSSGFPQLRNVPLTSRLSKEVEESRVRPKPSDMGPDEGGEKGRGKDSVGSGARGQRGAQSLQQGRFPGTWSLLPPGPQAGDSSPDSLGLPGTPLRTVPCTQALVALLLHQE